MANLTETSTWEAGIYQIEETDVVRGGPVASGGISNRQGQELGNRTKFLYDRLGRVSDINEIDVSADITLNAAEIYDKFVALSIRNTAQTITIATTDLPDNVFCKLAVVIDLYSPKPGCVKLAFPAGISIYGSYGSYGENIANRLWLYQGESVSFYKKGSKVFITELIGNHDTVGEILYRPAKPAYGVEAKGQLVLKSQYPRLWLFADTNNLTIPDSTWLGSESRKGLFGVSNVPTQFRLPDLRGVFIRGLDNGRGLDIDRPFSGEGVYQADAFKSHTHPYSAPGPNGNHPGGDSGYKRPNEAVSTITGSTGGVETRPKNIAYTAYLKY